MIALISMSIAGLATYSAAMTGATQPPVANEQLRAYADCLARRAPNDVANVLDGAIGPDLDQYLSKISVKKCPAAPTGGISSTELRTAIIAGMYRRFSPRAGSAAGTIVWQPQLPASHPLAGWYKVMACLVRVEPNVTRDWLNALHGSRKAADSFNFIVAALPKCLPSGQQFKLDRSLFESLLAETLYRIEFAVGPGDKVRFQ